MRSTPHQPGASSALLATRPWVVGLLLVFAVGFGLRALHVAALADGLSGPILVQDSRFYHERALQLIAPGETRAGEVEFTHVGYPYFVAAIYRLAGPRPVAVLWVQALLGSLAAVCLALAVRVTLSRDGPAIVAGLAYALYNGAIFYDGLLLTPSLVNSLLAAAWLALALGFRSGRVPAHVAAGVLLGLATLVRSNTAILVALLGLVLVLLPAATEGRGRRVRALALLAGAALPVLPFVALSSVEAGRFVPLSANGGMNFWAGNNRDAEGIYYQAPFLERLDVVGERDGYVDEARRRSGDASLDVTRAGGFWLREGLREIRDAPRRWVAIEARKLFLFWNRYEAKTNVGLEFAKHVSPVLRFNPLGFGLLAVLGVAGGVALYGAGERRIVPTAAAVGGSALITCVAFFVSGEYRHPLGLALCAGTAGLIAIASRLRRGELPRAPLAGLLVSGLLVSVPFAPLAVACHPRLDYSNHALALFDRGGRDAEAYEQALSLLDRGRQRLGPDLLLARAEFSLCKQVALERFDREAVGCALRIASQVYSTALADEISRYSAPALTSIAESIRAGLVELSRHDVVFEDSRLRREVALLGANDFLEIFAALEGGSVDAAREFADEALLRAPEHPQLLALAGRTLLAEGNEPDGVTKLLRGFRAWPPSSDAAFFLGEYFYESGDFDGARAALEEALRRDARHHRARFLLEQVVSASTTP
ncbi:MAG: hypothetical protein GY716_17720 [bacterium]|nr:hypothetical protein [bacterium]